MEKSTLNWDSLLHRSYASYSGKPEACLIMDQEGFAHPGVKIENASYPDSISAIQSALFGCLTSGKIPKEIIYRDIKSIGNPHQHQFYTEEFQLKTLFVEQITHINLFNPFLQLDSINILNLEEFVSYAKVKESNFPVVCLIKTEFGSVLGVNIEFSDWRMGLCAERVALSRCLSNGVKNMTDLHVFAPKAAYCAPCGACRQVINEHIPQERLYLYHSDKTHSEIIASYLLPHAFLGNDLKK